MVAQGTEVRSAAHDSDMGYAMMSNPGNGAPHAAGVAALLKGVRPEVGLGWAVVMQVLRSSADPVVPKGLPVAGFLTGHPNNVAGHGKLNAARAVQMALEVTEP